MRVGLLTSPATEWPFSLTIRGARGGNLLRIPDGTPGTRPFVLPDSLTLEASADDLGGRLSFTVEQNETPIEGPWWSATNLPDNALVEYTQNRIVDPILNAQSRLFTGFIDTLEVTANPGGRGTIAQVTCVSTNTILDKIIVRKPIGSTKVGLAVGRVTIKAGTDRAQIRAILKLVAEKRTYGDVLIFDPGKWSQITETATGLPKLEIPVGTLREALEAVMESAQGKDGKRRGVYVDPQTGALVYGLAGATLGADPTAPWEITDDPQDENFVSPTSASVDDTLTLLRPTLSYRFSEAAAPILNRTSVRSADLTLSSTFGGSLLYNPHYNTISDPVSGTYTEADPTFQVAGPFKSTTPNNYGARLARPSFEPYDSWNDRYYATSQPPIRGRYFGSTTISAAAQQGERSVSFYAKGSVWINIGGYYGMEIQTDGLGAITARIGTENNFAWNASTTNPVSGWHHYAIAFGKDTTRIWIDKKLLLSNIDTFTSHVADPADMRPWLLVDAAMDVNVGDYEQGGEEPTIAALSFYGRALRQRDIDLLDADFEKSANKIIPRELRIEVDHSRVAKTAIFLTADSRADKDTDPDPYVRRYDKLRNSDNTGPAFTRRNGPRFEAVVEAPTIRSAKVSTRSSEVDRFARAWFTPRHKPELGGEFIIRGAGPEANQTYGFSGGWAPSGASYVYVRTWRPGQYVRVTNHALGLENVIYRIETVSQTFEPGSFIRAFTITVERRPAGSIARLIATE